LSNSQIVLFATPRVTKVFLLLLLFVDFEDARASMPPPSVARDDGRSNQSQGSIGGYHSSAASASAASLKAHEVLAGLYPFDGSAHVGDEWLLKCRVPVTIHTMPSRVCHAQELCKLLSSHFRDVLVSPAVDTRGLSQHDIDKLVRHGIVTQKFAQICADPVHGFGAIGCALSHARGWAQLIEYGADWMVVLEDDVKTECEQLLQEVNYWQGKSESDRPDFVILGCNCYYDDTDSSRQLVDPPFSGVATDWKHLVEMNGTQGYLISKQGARKAAKYVLPSKVPWVPTVDSCDGGECGINGHVDHVLSEASIKGVLRMAYPRSQCVFNSEVSLSSTRTSKVVDNAGNIVELLKGLREGILAAAWGPGWKTWNDTDKQTFSVPAFVMAMEGYLSLFSWRQPELGQAGLKKAYLAMIKLELHLQNKSDAQARDLGLQVLAALIERSCAISRDSQWVRQQVETLLVDDSPVVSARAQQIWTNLTKS